jgi:uncharacterized protein YndB with AHSA1/START domain
MSVKFEQHIKIDAPNDIVWAILTDPNKWPLWFPAMEQVTGFTGVKNGATFQFQHGETVGSGSISNVDEAAGQILVTTQDAGHQVTHFFDIDRSGLFGIGGGSNLKYMMEYDPPGGFLGDIVAGGNPADMLKVKHTLEKVRDLAEGQAGKR